MKKTSIEVKEDKEWIDYRSRFSEVYDNSNYDKSLQAKVMACGHRELEKPYGPDVFFNKILEVGAGTCEHLKFVRHKFENYIVSDIDESTLSEGLAKIKQFNIENISIATHSANILPYEDNTFDRVIATHILEHLTNPHEALKEWKRVLKVGGTLSILIPTDPGLMWRIGRHLGPRKKALEQGFNYEYIMAREHINSSFNLIALIKFYFPNAKLGWWPLPFKFVDINLFIYCNVRV